jgi:phosphoglycolate phosphatase
VTSEITNLLFDFDGTLHDTIRIYAPAFRKAYHYLTNHGFAGEREWTDSEISKWLGYTSRDMWEMFMPGLPEKEKEKCSSIIGIEMLTSLKSGGARLYSGAADALRQLKSDGYRLILLSNCKLVYMRESNRRFSLEQFFSAFYCAEQYGYAPKYEIFHEIAGNHDGSFVVIGDRKSDMEIADMNGLPSIGCSFGYGNREELISASATVSSPAEIVDAVRRLTGIKPRT